ncbi:MAG: Cytochrome c, partial [Candidatus Woesebacteria bacterium GW2011_GWA1_39_8]
MGEDSRSLDAQLSKIQKSTRTLVPAVLPLHDILRQKYSWYYKWSLFPASKIIHWLILLLYIAGAGFITFNLFNQPKTILAASSTKAAGLGENVAGAWDDWSTPTNIYTNNNAYAVVSDVSSILSDQLKATNFGFAIPAGATINGVQVNIYRFADSNDPDLDSTQDSTVQLVKAGSATGNNKADLATYWPTVETLKSYGGAADLWGVALTAADVNASNFGVILVIQSATDANTPQTSNVDYIEIAVTYTEATTPTYDQKHYKFYQDDAGLNLATQLAAEDTTYSNASVSTNYRVRIETANTGTGAGNISRRLEFKEDAGAWTQITTNSNNVRLSLSSQFADAAATTQRLTGVGTFTAGQGKESGSDTSSISLTNAYNTEDEYSFAFQTGAASKTYQFRISNAGVALTTYTQTPQMAVASAPTVTTSAATGVTATTATGNGEITATGGLNSPARGFKVSSAGAGTCDDTTTFSEAGSYGLGTFTTPAITGLTASTAYRYRAFATNPNGTSYGSCQQFTTLAAGPTV